MSRITKRKFGVLGNDTYPHIPVEAAGFAGKNQITEDATTDVYIVKQKSARRFKVQHAEDGDTAVCKLVDKSYNDSSAIVAGEMVVVGYLNGQAITLRKINNRTCADFNGNRYKYTLTDDSSTTLMILTAITY